MGWQFTGTDSCDADFERCSAPSALIGLTLLKRRLSGYLIMVCKYPLRDKMSGAKDSFKLAGENTRSSGCQLKSAKMKQEMQDVFLSEGN